MNILVVGASCIDKYIYGTCNRLCPEAPVPIIIPSFQREYGGMAKNVFNNSKAIAKQYFSNYAIDLITNTNPSTKTRIVDVRTNQMIVRIDEEEIKEKLDLSSTNLDAYDAIIVSDYNKGYMSKNDLSRLGSHKLSFVDSKRPVGNWAKEFNFIKVNQFEYNVSKHFIDKHLLDKTIITCGERGVIYNKDGFPAPKIIATTDTSGAGDTFLSAFSLMYISTKSIENSIRHAQDCCIKVLQKRGTATI